jgi:predicted SprT family Zn-dependent metalloprotease
MFIYDSTSTAFIQKAEQFLREILTDIGIKVSRSRFEVKDYFYPIHIVVFEGKEWGHFNSTFLQIGLNRKLLYNAKDSVIRDILKHELAHYLTYIYYSEVGSHGTEFHSICHNFGFPKEIAYATLNLEESNLAKEGDLHSERVLEKVKKLLSLAQSSNTHEAELATMKANDLLLRHNLDYLKDKQEPIYMDRLLLRTRKDFKITAVHLILKHFIVRVVISNGLNACCLEVSGSLTNVKLAGYVANFLNQELDHLWKEASKEHNLKGLKAKNSFYLGVAEGFNKKMKLTKKNYSAADQQSLVIVENKLHLDTNIIYKRLGKSRSSHQSDQDANQIGQIKGMNLTIRNAVEGKERNLYLTNK